MKGEGTMHKKLKIEGHNAHVLRDANGRDTGCLYTVNPEEGRVTAWIPLCVCDTPASYLRFKAINIIPRMLGRHGYLQGAIKQLRDLVVAEDAVNSLVDSLWGDGSPLAFEVVDYCQNDVSVTENGRTYLTRMNHMSPDERIDKAFRMISKINKEESNMNHYVLRCKIKSDNDRVILADECIQVIQDRNKFTLLFDKADISEEEFKRFANYLHSHTGGLLKNCYHNISYEFGNYMVRVTVRDSDVCTPASARAKLLDILTEGIKQHGVYPCTPAHRLFDDVSYVAFYIQELGPTAEPIYKKGWPSLLNGTLHLDAYVIKTAGADGHVITNNRTYMYSEFDPKRSISVKNGKLDVGAIWATQPYLLDKTYISETELISDFRDLFDKGKIFVNASRLVTTFEPDRE